MRRQLSIRETKHSWRRAARWAMAALCALPLGGCSRGYYRKQADNEVYGILKVEPKNPAGPVADFTIQPGRGARFFDPNPADCPPMPPDDPASHQFMHCVDGKWGFRGWHRFGEIPTVENPDWEAFLPLNRDGQLVLDLVGATQVARVNSRQYQTELEDLYLSALDVTFERFRFSTQFFGGNVTTMTARGKDRGGGGTDTTWNTTTSIEAQRLFANGGTAVVGLANSVVWQVAGPNTYAATSLLDFSLFQPLLRGASRARVLERLTLAERTLLGNVRLMERYQQGFVTEIATGVNAPAGPARRGGVFGGTGLEGFTGTGGTGFGGVGNVTINGAGGAAAAGGGFAGGAGAGDANGFWGRLQDLQQIRNQEANVAALKSSLAQLELSGIDRFQVDQARQALYNAESILLTSRVAFQDAIDAFKIQLGLPPRLQIVLDEKALAPFQLIDPQLNAIQAEVDALQLRLRSMERNPDAQAFLAEGAKFAEIRQRIVQHLSRVDADFQNLDNSLNRRRQTLDELSRLPAVQRGDLEPQQFDRRIFDARIMDLHAMRAELLKRLAASDAKLDAVLRDVTRRPVGDSLKLLSPVMGELSSQLLELSLVQARTRMESVDLTPIRMNDSEALTVARRYRLDWMNARASVVDAWRLIEFNANDLESGLNITAAGDLGTKGDNPFAFHSSTGQLRLGLEFDAPLTRLAERNNYRQSLIEYQRARRNFMDYEDRLHLGLRTLLRTLERNRLNFELRRAAVAVAITQVDLARLKLLQPPPPAAAGQPPQQRFSATTARDLLSALSDLLQVQNDFLSVWINYEVARMVLDRDLGTMQIDPLGQWSDPGTLDFSQFEPFVGSASDRDWPPALPRNVEQIIEQPLPPKPPLKPGVEPLPEPK